MESACPNKHGLREGTDIGESLLHLSHQGDNALTYFSPFSIFKKNRSLLLVCDARIKKKPGAASYHNIYLPEEKQRSWRRSERKGTEIILEHSLYKARRKWYSSCVS